MALSPRLLRPRAGRSGGGFDADARAYIVAVEAADGQALETAVGVAINDFVVGCKADGIWSAISASCLLAGARTLAGALIPMVGPTPTNNGPFVTADYSRKTGLKGNGSTKYLSTGLTAANLSANNAHISVMVHTAATGTSAYIGHDGFGAGSSSIGKENAGLFLGVQVPFAAFATDAAAGTANGFIGASRGSSTSFSYRFNESTLTQSSNSVTTATGAIEAFGRGGGAARIPTDGRLRWYSVGQNIVLATLNSRLTSLMSAIEAAIP